MASTSGSARVAFSISTVDRLAARWTRAAIVPGASLHDRRYRVVRWGHWLREVSAVDSLPTFGERLNSLRYSSDRSSPMVSMSSVMLGCRQFSNVRCRMFGDCWKNGTNFAFRMLNPVRCIFFIFGQRLWLRSMLWESPRDSFKCSRFGACLKNRERSALCVLIWTQRSFDWVSDRRCSIPDSK
uniref:(northern house mosquito) hypothetical protein n=1 Tax=Culex pipiens TaxID=7175 RepID=A0A8D8NJA5_CULPI